MLYDIASAVMYLGGRCDAQEFLNHYSMVGHLPPEEWQHLDSMIRFRWAVQAAFFAQRLQAGDMMGLEDASENLKGLLDAKHGLQIRP